MYSTSSFLKFAKKEINDKIKESSIDETEDLIKAFTNKDYIQDRTDILKKNLYQTERKIKNLQRKINEKNKDLNDLKNYRNELYSEEEFPDEIQNYAHNLGIYEFEIQESLEELYKEFQKIRHQRIKIKNKLTKFLNQNRNL